MPLKPDAKYTLSAEDRTAAGIASAQRRLTRFTASAKQIITTGFAALGGGLLLRSIIRETAAAENAMAQLRAGVKSTGGVAGFTADELAAMAGELQNATTFADDAISAMQAQLLTFTKIRGEVFEKTQQAVLDLSTRMDQDLRTSVVQLGKALNDPILGVTALAKAGIQFTASQKETIKTLVESGNLVGAQTIILKELETQFGGSAAAAKETFGGALTSLKNAFGDLMEADQGLPAAVDDLNDLTELLQDPMTKKAAQELTGTLIRGFATAAKGIGLVAAGLNVLITGGDAIGKLDKEIASLESRRQRIKQLITDGAPGPRELANYREQLIDINIELGKARDEQSKLLGIGEFGPGGRLFEPPDNDALKNAIREVNDATIELGVNAKDAAKELELLLKSRSLEAEGQPGFIGPPQSLHVGASPEREALSGDPDLGPQPTAEQAAAAIDFQKELADEAARTAAQLSVFADEAARNMQDHFADFLFDPFEKGLDGMLKGFVDVIRRMAAEAAAAQLFKALAGSAFGGWLGLTAAAAGGTTAPKAAAMGGRLEANELALVGERGPELVRFGSASTVIPNHALGGPNVYQTFHVQAGLPPQWQAQLVMVTQISASAAQQAIEKRLGGRR